MIFDTFENLFLKNKHIFIYLDLCTGSSLQHVGSLIFAAAFGIFSCGKWDLAP